MKIIISWLFITSSVLACDKVLLNLIHDYMDTQQNFNPIHSYEVFDEDVKHALTHEIIPADTVYGTGRVPLKDSAYLNFGDRINSQIYYWDIDFKTNQTHQIIETNTKADIFNPFRPNKSTRRVFGFAPNYEYLDDMISKLGPPTGTFPARMTLSIRTIAVFEPGIRPYQIKLSGDFFTRKKGLNESDVKISTGRSKNLSDIDGIIPEPAAIEVNKIHNLYRPFPKELDFMGKNDHFVGLHALFDPEFQNSILGKKIIAKHGQYKTWLLNELAPAIANFLFESTFKSAQHFEIHTQNLEFWIGGDTEIKMSFVKDLLDVKSDPVMELSLGRDVWASLKYIKNNLIGDVVDLPTIRGSKDHSLTTIEEWYHTWMMQFSNAVIAINSVAKLRNGTKPVKTPYLAFHERVLDTFYERFSKEIQVSDARKEIIENAYNRFDDEDISRDLRPMTRLMNMMREAYLFETLQSEFLLDESISMPNLDDVFIHSKVKIYTHTSALSPIHINSDAEPLSENVRKLFASSKNDGADNGLFKGTFKGEKAIIYKENGLVLGYWIILDIKNHSDQT